MSLRTLVFGLGLVILSASLWAADADGAGLLDDASRASAWKPQHEGRVPVPFTGSDMQPALRFQVPFSQVTDWRVYWDLDLKADLGHAEQFVITLRAADPAALSQGVLYFRSGPGWYALPPFAVGKDWTTVVLNRGQAVAEGAPTGWNSVDGLRLSFSPAHRRDTIIELAALSTRSSLPLAHLGAVGGHKDLKHAADALRASARGLPQEADVEARLRRAEALAAQAASSGDADARKMLILEGRQKVAQAYALMQAPKDGEFRGLWLHYGDGVRALDGDRVKRWKEALPEMRAQGFNAVLPNVLWSGLAFYPSRLVPNHAGVTKEGDYLQEIIDAARPLGMKVHAWKVMWQFAEGWLAPVGVSEPFRAAASKARSAVRGSLAGIGR